MIQRAAPTLAELYELDETAWLDEMAGLVQHGQWSELDYLHLGEYLADTARRDRREVESRLATLLTHVLKWIHQPQSRSGSWRATIIEQRFELSRLIARGVLRNHAEVMRADAYTEAVQRAAAETGLKPDIFPRECPYSLQELMSEEMIGE